MGIVELSNQLTYINRVCGYKEVDVEFELEWVFDDYYANAWEGNNKVAEHLSGRGDFEKVWEWLATRYPEVDWNEQDF